MSVLVIAQHDNNSLNSVTLSCIKAATEISASVTVLILGYHDLKVIEGLRPYKAVSKIIYADSSSYERFLAENLADQVVALAQDFTHILAPATTFGKNFLPRVAALLDVGQLSEVTAIYNAETFERPIYAGKAYTVVQSLDPIKVMTIRPSAFEPVTEQWSEDEQAVAEDRLAPLETLKKPFENNHSRFESLISSESKLPDLNTAKRVVSVGRGIQGEDNLKMVYRLAEQLNAAVGASRAAVDAGYIGNDHQVGQTGKVVAPELYIAIGISGAVQHLAGMSDSKVIVAINKDPEAPIFEIADYYIVDNLFRVIPELTRAIEKNS